MHQKICSADLMPTIRASENPLGESRRSMKSKRVIIITVLTVLIGAYAISIAPNFRHRSEWKRTVAALRNLPRERLNSAVENFTRDQKALGRPLPPTVAFGELVSGGYLRKEETAALNGTITTVALGTDEAHPRMVVIRVQFPDGCTFAELADGSIQGLAK